MKVTIMDGLNTVIYNQPRIMSVNYDYNQEQYMFIVDGYEVGYVNNKHELMFQIQTGEDVTLDKTSFKQYEVKKRREL